MTCCLCSQCHLLELWAGSCMCLRVHEKTTTRTPILRCATCKRRRAGGCYKCSFAVAASSVSCLLVALLPHWLASPHNPTHDSAALLAPLHSFSSRSVHQFGAGTDPTLLADAVRACAVSRCCSGMHECARLRKRATRQLPPLPLRRMARPQRQAAAPRRMPHRR